METVFIGDLSFHCSEDNLRDLFQPFGKVLATIVRRTKSNQTLYYGFVQMKSAEDAIRAVEELDGTMFMGRIAKVSISKADVPKLLPNENTIQTRNRVQVNEVFLNRIFSRFGTVADCVVKQYTKVDYPKCKQCGYAYVYFYELSAAKRAIASLSGDRKEEIDGVRLDCKLSLESAQKLQALLGLETRVSETSTSKTSTSSASIIRDDNSDHSGNSSLNVPMSRPSTVENTHEMVPMIPSGFVRVSMPQYIPMPPKQPFRPFPPPVSLPVGHIQANYIPIPVPMGSIPPPSQERFVAPPSVGYFPQFSVSYAPNSTTGRLVSCPGYNGQPWY